ncbi:AfsR/SARP family transcriptional regulator [Micromonospora sp. Llam7]|uniref:AfsR/SARP family transcriptional regulator n=1 Tax=Micromonospora tarapacensis TaxID=2835305 RepID=UPI001C82EC29|nr:AfsR/SARP family transcriptional regulator [Micromonospora tarapacensis]MBX7265707.1 AfsR/SARP family transcriptional regulator [Micromonospora tarapacensis]
MTFSILGPARVAVAGVPVPIDSPALRAVLAALLISREHQLRFDGFERVLWDRPPPSSESNIRSYVARLRARFRTAGPDLEARLTSARGRGGYLLRVADGEFDLAVFTELTRRAQARLRQGRLDDAADLLHRAVGLWHGPAGSDVNVSGALMRLLEDLDEQRVVAVEDLLDVRLALGESGSLLQQLRTMVLENPTRERPRAQLIRALYLAGDPSGALLAYQQARADFDELLGIGLPERIERLQHAVLRRDEGWIRQTPAVATTGRVSPAGAQVVGA